MKEDKIDYLKDLPDYILNEVESYTSDSTVAMLGYSNKDEPVSIALASGTLVSIKSRYGILTAKHVWEIFISNKEINKIHFSILGYHHYLTEKIERLNAIIPSVNVDLCFIELPNKLIGTIKAKRTFYPIYKENTPEVENIKKYLWLTIGFPLLLKSSTKKVVFPLRYFTHLVNYKIFENQNYDELELEINYNNENSSAIPCSLGGMSGGGIWNFQIFYNDDSDDIKYFLGNSQKTKILAGVNYFQTAFEGNKRKLKGVGPRAIYKLLFDFIDN